jgi:hypothetical protein
MQAGGLVGMPLQHMWHLHLQRVLTLRAQMLRLG